MYFCRFSYYISVCTHFNGYNKVIWIFNLGSLLTFMHFKMENKIFDLHKFYYPSNNLLLSVSGLTKGPI